MPYPSSNLQKSIMKKISVILPCYNEEENIKEVYSRLLKTLSSVNMDYEFIFIDDGSTDNSLEKMKELHNKDKNVVVIEFSRNFGHQASICCGLDYSNGDAVLMMDADLQHPIEIIPELIKKWEDGFDVVNTQRKDAGNVSLFKKYTSKIFYYLINIISDIKIPENSADFRLIDKKAVEYLKKLSEKTKFYRGLIQWVGFKQTLVSYDVKPRKKGKTKYSFLKMIRFALDGILSFSAFPLQISFFLGLIVSFFSFSYAAFAIYIKIFTNAAVPGWTSVLASVLFLGGIQLIILGIMGEYLNKIYIELKGRPSYIINNILQDLQPINKK